jgi:hypothetical protein
MRLTAVFSGVLYGSQIEYKHTTGTCVKCAGKSLPPYISPFESEIGSGGQLACGVGIDMSQGPVYKFPSSIFGYGRECPIINNQVIEKTLLRCSADLSRRSGCPSAHTSQPGSRRAFYCTTTACVPPFHVDLGDILLLRSRAKAYQPSEHFLFSHPASPSGL